MPEDCESKATGTARRRWRRGAPSRTIAVDAPDILNGGIIASLIDCHSLNLAIAYAYRAEKRSIGSSPRIGYVTASLNVTYLKPTPINEPVELRACIAKLEGRKAWVNCTLSAAGEIRATGEVLGIRVNRRINCRSNCSNSSTVQIVLTQISCLND